MEHLLEILHIVFIQGNQYIEEKILPLLIRGNIYAYISKPKIGRILS